MRKEKNSIKKTKVIYKNRLKPTRYRFKGNIRLGFRGRGKVVEIAKFKQVKR